MFVVDHPVNAMELFCRWCATIPAPCCSSSSGGEEITNLGGRKRDIRSTYLRMVEGGGGDGRFAAAGSGQQTRRGMLQFMLASQNDGIFPIFTL